MSLRNREVGCRIRAESACPRMLLTSVAAVVFWWLLFVAGSNTVVLLAAVNSRDGCYGRL